MKDLSISQYINDNCNIITFGSCLSRFTANHYKYLFGGKLVSSVYHNRSDIFLSNFFGNPYFDNPLTSSQVQPFQNGEINKAIIKNQYKSSLGLHNLPNGIPLFDAIKKLKNHTNIIIFMDNYIDAVAKVVEIQNHKLFLRIEPSQINTAEIKVVDMLDLEISIKNFQKIIRWLKNELPMAKIVFLCFPYETYQLGSLQRERLQFFSHNFFSWECSLIIRARLLSDKFKTEEKQHFKSPYYAGIAGLVYSSLYSALIS